MICKVVAEGYIPPFLPTKIKDYQVFTPAFQNFTKDIETGMETITDHK